MNSAIHAAARLALASGLVAGAWLILSASTPGVETFLPAGAATAAEPDRIQLAQADAAPVERPVSYSSEQADRGEDQIRKGVWGVPRGRSQGRADWWAAIARREFRAEVR